MKRKTEYNKTEYNMVYKTEYICIDYTYIYIYNLQLQCRVLKLDNTLQKLVKILLPLNHQIATRILHFHTFFIHCLPS